MRLALPLFLSGTFVFSASAAAVPQQFTVQAGLPGPNRWSEGVAAVDVDLDGDKDLLFANGDGFSNASTKRQNLLVINRQVEQAPGVFVDESVARLGARVSNAKQAIAGDVNGDGYPDLLYVNSFNTDTPFLYINRGAAQPGFFDMESATRGLTEVLSSAGAQFGDLDDDGDLDLVITDSGASFLGGAGARPKLYLNDGIGNFSDVSAQLNASVMVAQMDVHLVDMDLDWDLDIVITNRGSTHYLLLNDGTANFTDASSLLPSTGMVYEAEVADFDGDLDVDFFFLSLSGFNEGRVGNDLVPSGTLGFTAGPTLSGGQDDNEIGLIDYDMDGDLDVLVGSLGPTERVYRNDGALAFTLTGGIVQGVGDSTLDLAIADLDGDGDYDFVTAQGESGNYLNRMYFNQGAADTLAPRFTGIDVPMQATAGTQAVHAMVVDQLLDDGEAFLSASASYARVRSEIVSVNVSSAGFAPNNLSVAPGTRLRFINNGLGFTSIRASGAATWERFLGANPVERAFVAPIAQVITATGAQGSLTVNVVGSSPQAPATHSGNGLFRAEVGPLPVGPTAEIAVVFRAEDDAGNVSWSDISAMRDADAPGVNYCDASFNSTGVPGRIIARGNDLLADQDLTLEGFALPRNSFGIFLASPSQGVMPLGSGTLCLSTPITRFQIVQGSGPSGMVAQTLNFVGLPPGITFQVGEAWNFTFWFRDVASATGINLTDGVEVTWR